MPDLDSMLAEFPIALAEPWARGWASTVRVTMEDGDISFHADGEQLTVAGTTVDEPVCRVRCTREQLRRLLAGDPILLLHFEGLNVDRLGDLFALQNVVLRSRRLRREAGEEGSC